MNFIGKCGECFNLKCTGVGYHPVFDPDTMLPARVAFNKRGDVILALLPNPTEKEYEV